MKWPLPAVLLLVAALAGNAEDTLRVSPRLEAMWTGRANVNGGKWSDNLAIITNPDFRAWAMFDLVLIPDSARVTGVQLFYTTFSGHDTAFSLWRHLTSDPLTASGPVLYAECGTASVVSDTAYDPPAGPAARALNPTGVAAVQAALIADRVAFGWQRYESEGWRYARGIETPVEMPSLLVSWTPNTSVFEPESQYRRSCGPVVPTTIRGVLLLLASGARREASRVLLDISGRKALELHPGPNDVSRLAPGIYFMRSAESEGRSAASVRKVVIQR